MIHVHGVSANHPLCERMENLMVHMIRRMMRSLAVIALATASVALPANAGTMFTASLSGLEEVPPNLSRGYGFSSIWLNDTEDSIAVDLSFYDLTAGATAAHIHGPANPGVNAGALFPFALGPLIGQTNGVVPQHMFAISPTQVNTLKSGQYYVNVHTSVFPGGEIRGQYNAIPEPGSLAFLGAGLFPLAGILLRRKRA